MSNKLFCDDRSCVLFTLFPDDKNCHVRRVHEHFSVKPFPSNMHYILPFEGKLRACIMTDILFILESGQAVQLLPRYQEHQHLLAVSVIDSPTIQVCHSSKWHAIHLAKFQFSVYWICDTIESVD